MAVTKISLAILGFVYLGLRVVIAMGSAHDYWVQMMPNSSPTTHELYSNNTRMFM